MATRFQLLADAAQFDEAQCGHRTQHGSKHDYHNNIHRARAPSPLVNVSDTCGRCIIAGHATGVLFGRRSGRETAHFFSAVIGLKSIAAMQYGRVNGHKRVRCSFGLISMELPAAEKQSPAIALPQRPNGKQRCDHWHLSGHRQGGGITAAVILRRKTHLDLPLTPRVSLSGGRLCRRWPSNRLAASFAESKTLSIFLIILSMCSCCRRCGLRLLKFELCP